MTVWEAVWLASPVGTMMSGKRELAELPQVGEGTQEVPSGTAASAWETSLGQSEEKGVQLCLFGDGKIPT